MKIRLIQISSTNGIREGVIFTDDFSCEAADYCDSELQVDGDNTLDMDMPSGFPLNYILWRE